MEEIFYNGCVLHTAFFGDTEFDRLTKIYEALCLCIFV